MEQDCKKILDGYNCGLGIALQMIGGKWKGVILWLLAEKPHRFGELKRDLLDISERILIKQLREMEQDKLILRHDFQSTPPKVEYSITPSGRTLLDALCPLSEWASSGTAVDSSLKNARIS
jgi:DNA-binding HxlR family transcriptional regulator